MYAGGIPIRKHLPGLSRYSGDDAGYEQATLISLWLGNRTHTAAHWDQSQNLACVVAGRRRFTLFPPEQLKNLYVGPLEFTLAGQPTSLVDIDAPDLENHPRFAEALKAARRRNSVRATHSTFRPVVARRSVARRFRVVDQFLVARRRAAAADPAQRALSCGHHDEGLAAERAGGVARDVRPLHLRRQRRPGRAPARRTRGILGQRTPELVARVKKLLIDALSR